VGQRPAEIRALLESYRLTLHQWESARMDRITIRESAPVASGDPVVGARA